MIREIRTCDICGDRIDGTKYYKVKIRSDMFINYCNYDMIGSDKKTIDVCKNCTKLFFKFVRAMKELSKKDGETNDRMVPI